MPQNNSRKPEVELLGILIKLENCCAKLIVAGQFVQWADDMCA